MKKQLEKYKLKCYEHKQFVVSIMKQMKTEFSNLNFTEQEKLDFNSHW